MSDLAEVAYSGDYNDLINKPTPEQLMKNIIINDLVFKDDLKDFFPENQADLIFKNTIKMFSVDNYPEILFRFGLSHNFIVQNDKFISDISEALSKGYRVIIYNKLSQYWIINNYQFSADYKKLKIVDLTDNFDDLLDLFINNYNINNQEDYLQQFFNFIKDKLIFQTKTIYAILDLSDPNDLIGYYFVREKD